MPPAGPGPACPVVARGPPDAVAVDIVCATIAAALAYVLTATGDVVLLTAAQLLGPAGQPLILKPMGPAALLLPTALGTASQVHMPRDLHDVVARRLLLAGLQVELSVKECTTP
jgi:hypothetical protein